MILFDRILFTAKNNGYCIGDMISGKWYECNKLMPDLENERLKIIDTKDNYLHFFGGCNDRTYHLKLDIFDSLPLQLINDNKNKNSNHNKLVYGYINENINFFKMNDKYPKQLSDIILMYSPIFSY